MRTRGPGQPGLSRLLPDRWGARAPDATTLIRLSQLLDETVLKDVLARLVDIGRRDHVIRGRRLRIDTTVVETNIHHPTDSTLLADGVRVVTRTLQRLGRGICNRTRSVARRVFEIAQRSRAMGVRTPPAKRAQSKARMKDLYRGLLRIARAVVRDAHAAGAPWPRRRPSHQQRLVKQLHATLALVARIVRQTRARVFEGDTHYPDKVVSVFEPHTEIIRKGKLAKPTEFGRRVKIQEAEGQFITDYDVCERGTVDGDLWLPALDRHIALFARPPDLAVADGGFASRTNRALGHAGCAKWCCRANRASPARGVRAPPCAGAPGVKDASARSNAVMECVAAGIAGRAACSGGSASASLPTI